MAKVHKDAFGIDRRCIAEVGTYKNGFHTCMKPAVVTSAREMFVTGYGMNTMFLDYCEQHRERAFKSESSLVRVARVTDVVTGQIVLK